MKIAGLRMRDPWAHRVLHVRGVETVQVLGQAAELSVMVEQVELSHYGVDKNFRPYLHVSGELRSVTPLAPLPHGVNQLSFAPGVGESIDAFYEFSDEQLVELARKGYFTDGFEVPAQVVNIEWELPAKIDALVLSPAAQEQLPVIFVEVRDSASLEVDLTNSGYDLSAYFADRSKNGEAERTTTREDGVDQRGMKARSDAINSLFSDSDYEVASVDEQRQVVAAGGEGEDLSDLDRRFEEVAAELDATDEQLTAERAAAEGTLENLYAKRVGRLLTVQEQESDVLLLDRPAETEAVQDEDETAEPTLLFDTHVEPALSIEPIDMGDARGQQKTRPAVDTPSEQPPTDDGLEL